MDGTNRQNLREDRWSGRERGRELKKKKVHPLLHNDFRTRQRKVRPHKMNFHQYLERLTSETTDLHQKSHCPVLSCPFNLRPRFPYLPLFLALIIKRPHPRYTHTHPQPALTSPGPHPRGQSPSQPRSKQEANR